MRKKIIQKLVKMIIKRKKQGKRKITVEKVKLAKVIIEEEEEKQERKMKEKKKRQRM